MLSRTLVSYDDIAAAPEPVLRASPTYADSTASGAYAAAPGARSKPAKKRRRPNGAQQQQQQQQQHWDAPAEHGQHVSYEDHVPASSNSAAPAWGPPPPIGPVLRRAQAPPRAAPRPAAAPVKEEEEEDDQDLMAEDWDDSALIDAWNAAQEEYEALNGPDKEWKKDPVHRSNLSWYKSPPSSSKPPAVTDGTAGSASGGDAGAEDDNTQPVDFASFVPTHDPSLPGVGAAAPALPGMFPAGVPMVTRDEAFQNAMSAMYWTGFYTAAYYYQGQGEQTQNEGANDEQDAAEVEEEIEEDGEPDFTPAQR